MSSLLVKIIKQLSTLFRKSHKVGNNGIIDIFESANNAKNVKNATVCFDGRSVENGVTGMSD